MSKKDRIYLLGPRGSGKTTVGLWLAKNLGWKFLDADEYLENSYGKTISNIFALEGEKRFRQMESEILNKLSFIQHAVIGTGGGVVLDEGNRAIIQKSGFCVWLKTSIEILIARLTVDDKTGIKRPQLLAGPEENSESRIRKEVMAIVPAREHFYQLCSNWECKTDGKSPEEIARLIQAEFNKTNC